MRILLLVALWALVVVGGVGLPTERAVAAPTVTTPALPRPSGWPLGGEVEVLAGFRPPATTWGAGHRGVDLAARPGASVRAAAAGVVTFAGPVAGRGVVVVDHGAVRTTYEPVRAVVAVGQRVAFGQRIGVLEPGTAGHCQGCLHWGLLAGETYLDPLLLVPAGSGPLRLLPRGAEATIARAAAERAEAARAAARAEAVVVQDQRALMLGVAGAHGFLRPVPGPITSAYGFRLHPVLHVWKLHDGTDFAAACGDPLRAPADGVVTSVGPSTGYGNRLFVDHGGVDGHRVVTALNHAAGYSVTVGQRVRRGQVVGAVGATGYATGCHLHLMVWLDGRLIDPMSWFG